MTQMRVSFTLSKQEFVLAWMKLQLRGRGTAWLIFCGVFVVLVGVLIGSVPLIAGGAAYIAFWLAYCVWWLPRRVWRKHERFSKPQAFLFSDGGITAEMAEVQSTTDWSYWIGLKQVGDIYALRSMTGYTFIPSRAIGDEADIERFREFLRARVHSAT